MKNYLGEPLGEKEGFVIEKDYFNLKILEGQIQEYRFEEERYRTSLIELNNSGKVISIRVFPSVINGDRAYFDVPITYTLNEQYINDPNSSEYTIFKVKNLEIGFINGGNKLKKYELKKFLERAIKEYHREI